MGMLEPLGTRAAHGALAAGCGNEVFPGLRRARLEQFTRPSQVFSAQLRVAHEALDIRQPFVIPGSDASRLDEVAEVLITGAAELHPPTVGTLEATTPDATRRGDDVGRVMDAHGTGADRWERGMKQRHLDPLPDAVAVPREQRHDDADDGLKGSIVGGDRDGSVDGAVDTGSRRAIGRCGSPDDPLEGAHLGAWII